MNKRIITLVLIGLVVVGCSNRPCSDQSERYFEDMARVRERWVITMEGSVDNIFTAGEKLEAVKEEAEDLKAPACAAETKNLLLQSMGLVIAGVDDGMAGKSFQMQRKFDDAQSKLRQLDREIRLIKLE